MARKLRSAEISADEMTTRIYLIRHGATAENMAGKFLGDLDVPLSEEGMVQAHRLAEHFAKLKDPIADIYCSPLQRAATTAGVIADILNKKPLIVDGLREMSFGDWDGKTSKEVSGDLAAWKSRSPLGSVGPTNGETLSQVADRAEQNLDTLASRHPGKIILAVSHVYFIKGALSRAVQVADGHLANRFFLDTGSVTLLDWSVDPEKRIVRRVNWTPSIDDGSERWGLLKAVP